MRIDRRALFRDLYGRREELTALDEIIRLVRAEQRGSIVLVSGDAGVGKTRLLTEVASNPSLARACVLKGSAADYGLQPYGLITQALASDGKAPAEIIGALDAPADKALDPLADRIRRFDLVEGYLKRRAARDGIVCLVLEDLHWSDAASLDFLLHLARGVDDIAILVIATYRTPDIESNLTLAKGIVRLQREGVRELNLAPLDRSVLLTAIVNTIPAGVVIPQEEVDAICDLAEGRPFVAEELLRDAIARAQTANAGRSVVISLRASVLERLVGFEPSERETLMAAAVVGREFDPELVASVLGLALRSVLRTLRRARDSQLVIEDRRTGFVSFRHAITREVLYQEMLASEARALHVRIADALASADSGAREAEIAYHLWAARSSGAVEANEQVGDRAAAIHAYADAAVCYGRALDLADRSGDAYPRLLQAVAFALCTIGDVGRARLRCEQAVEALRGRGHQERAFRQMLYVARQYYETGDVESALATVERVREELRDIELSPLHYAAEVALTGILSLQGRGAESIQVLDRATGLDVEKDLSDVCRAAFNRGLAYTALAEYDECIGAFHAALPIAKALDRADLVAHAYGNVGSIAGYLGRTDLSVESFTQGTAIAKEHGHMRTLVLLQADFADTLLERGDLAGSGLLAAVVVGSQHTSIVGQMTGRMLLTRLRSLRWEEPLADADDLAGQLARALEYGEPQMIASVGGAVAEAEWAAGLPSVNATVDETIRKLTTPELSHRICDFAARVASPEIVQIARNLLLRATRAHQNPAGAAHLLLFDARLAARRGETEEARALALRAAEAFRGFPWPVEEAEALEVAGELEGALAIYRRIGATRPARRLEDALGVRRSAQTKAAGVLSRREEEVCDLLVRGHSYKSIGDELGIGERTVETHAKSVYRKMGVKTRLELVAQRGRAS